MPKIYFVSHEGEVSVVEAEVGSSLMAVANEHSIAGIDADCGGECSCGTCHVILDKNWAGKVTDPSDFEESMLSMNADRQAHSRLSCQVEVKAEHDGFKVNIPSHQM